MRILRIVTGVGGLIYAIVKHDYLLGIAGLFLLFTGLFNVAGCGVGGCTLPNRRNPK